MFVPIWALVMLVLYNVLVAAVVIRIIYLSMKNIEKANAHAMMGQTVALGAINARLAATLEAEGIGDPVAIIQNSVAAAGGKAPRREPDSGDTFKTRRATFDDQAVDKDRARKAYCPKHHKGMPDAPCLCNLSVPRRTNDSGN